ncbi:MAG: hypothetical protein WDO06_07980 [Actinomycetota bacterium]
MSSKTKAITIAITTVALSLGSVGIASASNSKHSVKVKVTSSKTIFKATANANSATSVKGNEGDLATVLAALVVKGTLTQAQVDAINAALVAARTSHKTEADAARTAHKTLIATTIGIDVSTLEKRLAAGDSLAVIAGAKTDALIKALVAEATKFIDAAVTAGKLTAAQATTFKANLTAQVTAQVNAKRGAHGPGNAFGGGKGPKGHVGFGGKFGGNWLSPMPLIPAPTTQG